VYINKYKCYNCGIWWKSRNYNKGNDSCPECASQYVPESYEYFADKNDCHVLTWQNFFVPRWMESGDPEVIEHGALDPEEYEELDNDRSDFEIYTSSFSFVQGTSS